VGIHNRNDSKRRVPVKKRRLLPEVFMQVNSKKSYYSIQVLEIGAVAYLQDFIELNKTFPYSKIIFLCVDLKA
jgi:hypothetical protein